MLKIKEIVVISKQRGVSLIEVLVAVVILSVGILGIAGIQVVSLQQNRSSIYRAEALQLANDILDRMRANPGQNYAAVSFNDPPPGSVECTTFACSATQMKDYDIAQWKCSINSSDLAGTPFARCSTLGIAGTLPQGQGAIVNTSNSALCPVVSADEICAIVTWQDASDGAQGSIMLRTRTN
mgnify:CR=1 FL=1